VTFPLSHLGDEPFVGRLAVERPVRPVVIVVVLPLPQLLVEQVNVVGDAVLVQELIELLVVDAVRSLHLAVQMRCSRPDVEMADVQGLEAPVRVRVEFAPAVGLHDLDAEQQSPPSSSTKRIDVPWLQAS